MRALEVTLFIIAVMACPTLYSALGLFSTQYNTCDAQVCQAQAFLYNMTSQTSMNNNMKPLDTSQTNPTSMGWDIVTFSLTFIVFAFFWMLYILSLVTIIAPAMVIMFHVPSAFANYINIFYWILWMLAIIQYKRGGFSVDTYK